MLGYYAALALRSFRGGKALTLLIVTLMGLGVATCMVAYAVFRVSAGDPLPGRSGSLFVPQIDNFGPTRTVGGEPPTQLSYTDAMALWRARDGRRLSLVYPLTMVNEPADGVSLPASLEGDAVTRDFFAMFDAPFRYGHAWSESDDVGRASAVVIGDRLNRRLFGGKDSTGQTLQLDGHVFRIVGVIADWNPRPRFYDVATIGQPFVRRGDIFVPFSRAVDLAKRSPYGYCSSTTADTRVPDFNAWLHSECDWIGAWVELRGATDIERYRQYLTAYSATQQQVGRFGWPPNVRLSSLPQWLASLKIVPKATTLSLIVAVSFLGIAIVNVMGLMLARFMRRSAEIGIRRALGASRRAIYAQFGVEAAAIGAAGAMLGVVLTWLGVAGSRFVFEPDIAAWARMDPGLLVTTTAVAVGATLCAALYPTWRAAQVQPAWQIKTDG
ncbi:ABC transporter permease [Luteibacter sp. dw_328]|uniref:ABC transporter permease n=1 Tax=Luteibacter sp. dw_328 TaxID=2719796 RepID=UPI001BD5DBBF|nr:ABC transporter permease [Luteibacter sp. dw_328]